MSIKSTQGEPRKVTPGSSDNAYECMWCAPSFKLDPTGPGAKRFDITGIDSAFIVKDVISKAEAAQLVEMAEKMGFARQSGDEAERRNGALSWVLHDALGEQLIRRLAPCLPWTVAVHSPGSEAPTAEQVAAGLPEANGIKPLVREVSGAPAGLYELASLSARSRVYRYEGNTDDAFLPHHDEVWPGSRLTIGADDAVDPTLAYDGWRYSSEAGAGSSSAGWSWKAGDRVSHLSVLLYLNDDFEGGQTLLHPEGGVGAEAGEGAGATKVAVSPEVGSALCFGQSFKLGRAGVAHSPDALLHEGLPVVSPAGRPLFLKPAAKYILRTDVCYTMPPPPKEAAEASLEAWREEADGTRGQQIDPRASQQMEVELSSDKEIRAKQLAALKEAGYDTSGFE